MTAGKLTKLEPVDVPGWFLAKSSSGKKGGDKPVELHLLRRVFLPATFTRSIRRFERGELKVDSRYKRYAGTVLGPTPVVACFDLSGKGSVIPFFVEPETVRTLRLAVQI